jgi:MoaA/NifB/PqqE/SkfB family radical SAM enzyme
MYHQIEITSRCNFSCFYCAGRDMPQRDMRWEQFVRIVDSIGDRRSTVSLQGEGEPSLHPQLMEMAEYVTRAGHVPYTILNGSRVDAVQLARAFPRVGISLDTLDPQEAERIGRHNLAKVLANVEALLDVMGPRRLIIMTVDMGQDLAPLRQWVRERGFLRHIVQPLSPKDDYARRYKERVAPREASLQRPSCRYLEADIMRFYSLGGSTMPCCFIKDAAAFTSIQALRAGFGAGHVPRACSGCGELRERHQPPARHAELSRPAPADATI